MLLKSQEIESFWGVLLTVKMAVARTAMPHAVAMVDTAALLDPPVIQTLSGAALPRIQNVKKRSKSCFGRTLTISS